MDTALAIVYWAVQASLAGLGVFVSTKAQPQSRHKWLAVAFIVLVGAGGVVNVAQQRRSSAAMAGLKTSLEHIDSNTRQSPQVTVNVPPPTVIQGPQPPSAASDTAPRWVSGPYAVKLTDRTIIETCSGCAVKLFRARSLPSAAITIKNRGTGTFSVTTSSGDTIDGEQKLELNPNDSITFLSDGTNWIVT